ncbi:MAG: methyltransferase [Polyangiaceae bacterium]|nr:methyltransferase [Polyangiaceae bacterium]
MTARGARARSPRDGDPEPTTRDALLDGAVILRQPARGYRVNVDSLLLARFAASVGGGGVIVDLGAGVGAVGLALAALAPVDRLVLVERDPLFARLAAENLADAAVPGEVRQLDLAGDPWPPDLCGAARLVLANPPYEQPGRGPGASDPRSRAARAGPVEPFLRAARAALAGPRASACVCFPARSLGDLAREADRARLHARRLRLVHARASDDARLALVELRSRPGPLRVLPALVEWDAPGRPTPELVALGQRRRG